MFLRSPVVALLAVARLLGEARSLFRNRPTARLHDELSRLRAENELLRSRLRRTARRANWTPWQRLRILWHRVRYGMTFRQAASIFVVREFTIRRWAKSLEERQRKRGDILPGLGSRKGFLRQVIHLLRWENPRWGTRRIAQTLVRLGLAASRSADQRALRKPPVKPASPGRIPRSATHRRPGIRAKRPHHVWLLDITNVPVPGGLFKIRVIAVLDAFSRSIVAPRATRHMPGLEDAKALMDSAIRRAGRRPGHLITDQGAQFTSPAFKRHIRKKSIRHRYGAVGSSKSIALIERLWRSLKEECSSVWLLFHSMEAIEARLLKWAEWHRLHRPHQGLGGQTPEDVLRGVKRRRGASAKAGDRWQLFREEFAGEKWLPVYSLRNAG